MEALRQAQELTNKILCMTQGLILTGEKEAQEQEVEAYAVLMEERAPLVEQLSKLKLGAQVMASAEFAAVRKTIESIAELDKQHLSCMGQMRDGVQQSYKEVKHGQKISAGYNPLPDETVSRMFDTKQ